MGTGVCIACGAADVEINEESKCPGCNGGDASPVAEASEPSEQNMTAPAETAEDAPAAE